VTIKTYVYRLTLVLEHLIELFLNQKLVYLIKNNLVTIKKELLRTKWF
jgi:hypothetical protein